MHDIVYLRWVHPFCSFVFLFLFHRRFLTDMKNQIVKSKSRISRCLFFVRHHSWPVTFAGRMDSFCRLHQHFPARAAARAACQPSMGANEQRDSHYNVVKFLTSGFVLSYVCFFSTQLRFPSVAVRRTALFLFDID